MAVYMSLPYRTRASVQPYPVVCTVARRPGQISGESGAAKAKPKSWVRGAPYHPLSYRGVTTFKKPNSWFCDAVYVD